jgi:alpha-N-arabinofuranosidase
VKKHLFLAVVLFVLFIPSLALALEYHLVIDASKKGPEIPRTLYGIFFEDINHAADWGVYAELVRNRSFEHRNPSEGWVFSGDEGVRFGIEDDTPLAPQNPHYLRVVFPPSGGRGQVVNEGYDGIPIEAGKTYRFSLFARMEGKSPGIVWVSLGDMAGKTYAEGEIPVLAPEWREYTLRLSPRKSCPSARLVLHVEGQGAMALDMVSLFPEDTWKGRVNGWRRDLVEMLAALQPGFLRFPGGCIVEGHRLENAYRWKKTVGPVVERPTQWNLWGYHQSFGLGFFEYFLLAEDLGRNLCRFSMQGFRARFGEQSSSPLRRWMNGSRMPWTSSSTQTNRQRVPGGKCGQKVAIRNPLG